MDRPLPPTAKTVFVVHTGHGCESGCCGHMWVAVDDAGHDVAEGGFQFTHPYGEPHESFAKALAGEAIAAGLAFDFALCEVSED